MTVFDELDVPVLVAPMAGGPSTPQLVVAAADAGALGFLAGGMRTPPALDEEITAVRRHAGMFGVNLFVPRPPSDVDVEPYVRRLATEARSYGVELGAPEWDDDAYAAKLDAVVAAQVPVVSFTFALPAESEVARVHAYGGTVVATVATPQEAASAAAIGADALCVQGMDGGGHRGGLSDDGSQPAGGQTYGVLAALRLVAAEVELPLVAAGGLATGADVAAVLAAGAVAAQLGTAFLRATEAGTSAAYRQALADGGRPTAMTRAFSGRPARGVVNRFLQEHSDAAPAAYPQVNSMTKPIRAAAAQQGDPEAVSLWAGQAYELATERPTAEIISDIVDEARTALRAVRL